MASVISNYGIDFSNIDFYEVTANAVSSGIYHNIEAFGVLYPDVVEVDWMQNGVLYASLFGGSNIVVDGGGNVVAGTVTGYLLEAQNGSTWTEIWGVASTSISAASLYQAFLTPGTADDQAIIQASLAGSDFIVGSPYADVLLGYNGNDVFSGGGGNDRIDGGSGINTVIYTGASSNYLITSNGSSYTITDISGTDGTDTLTNIQYLQFADRQISLTPNSLDNSITELYIGYYNRAPDPSGETYWVGTLAGGLSLSDIAQSYSVQVESTTLYPFLASPNTASTAAVQDFVTSVYENLFNRAPDAAGEAYWVKQLQTGASTVGGAIINIISGAQNADLTTIHNKETVGDYFDNQIYSHSVLFSAAVAKSALGVVTSDPATIAAAEALVDSYISTAPHASLAANEPHIVGLATDHQGSAIG